MDRQCEILIIGGGAAGLTCGMYLRRFLRDVMIVDAGGSRLHRIPLSHNTPGFPQGIRGAEYHARLQAQLSRYEGTVRPGRVRQLQREGDCFVALGDDFAVRARFVVLATGVSDNELMLPEVGPAIERGFLRYCPICDGFEVIGKRIGVIVCNHHGLAEARYLRTFTERVVIIPLDANVNLGEDERQRALADGLALADSPLTGLMLAERAVEVEHADGGAHYDSLYCALGTTVHSGLAHLLGAELDADGYVLTDAHCQTRVDGLYAIGDVSTGINQIAVASGKAAIAASALQLRLGLRH
ncbi:MAG: NAD(P)/FAD-dependent oxidoreductase [Rhodocyclaceae bacterium]